MGEIELTNTALSYFQKRLAGKQGVVGVRLKTPAAGCSGFSYVIDFAKEIFPDDLVFENSGVKVIVDQLSIKNLDNLQIDCVQEGLSETIKFNNPNVKGTCGCGESFSIE
jgi:iron-sulfur cluster assembly protein